MSYRLNKTNGELLIELVDGQIDATSTDLVLVGRNYKGFGEFLNENYIKLLENFAKTSAPGKPLTGQLWYDTAEERLKIYNGETFKSAGGPVVSNVRPNLVIGDLWIDSENNKLYFFDGSDLVLVGPNYDAAQGKTGFEAVTILDRNSQDQTVLYMYVAGQLTGVISRTTFIPLVNIVGYPLNPDDLSTPRRQIVYQGLNPVNEDFWFRGTSQSTRSLISDAGEEFTEANFMKTDRNTTTTGNIKIRNSGGLSIGISDTEYLVLKIASEISTIETQRSNRDFTIRTRRGNSFDNAFYVDATNKRAGIWTVTPTVDFDVNGSGRFTGDLEVEGNLLVTGNTTYLDVATLRVEDKNIELAYKSDSTLITPQEADGAGIIVRMEGDSKTLTWEYETSAWTSSENFDLVSGKVYKINNVTKLSANRLDDSILYAEGLISIGTLVQLNVDNFNFNGSNITVSAPLGISSTGTITINNQNITGVLDPVTNFDVANKRYVDQTVASEPVVLSLDVTGLSNPNASFASTGPYNDVIAVLNFMYPASEKQSGTVARVYGISYTGTTVSGINVTAAANKSYVSVYVDPEDSTTPQLESVLQDINFTTVSGVANLSPSRGTMEFIVNGGVWQWVRTNPI
jgi:hypothetical protein